MKDKIEEVVVKVYDMGGTTDRDNPIVHRETLLWAIKELTQICQLFEPKPESRSVQRRKAIQQGKPMPSFSKPDEGRLLTYEEIISVLAKHSFHKKEKLPSYEYDFAIAQAQDAKTAPIAYKQGYDDACKGIEARFTTRNEVDVVDKKVKPFYKMKISVKDWQALKKQEGIDG